MRGSQVAGAAKKPKKDEKTAKSIGAKETIPAQTKKDGKSSSSRINAYDFRSWDKFDAVSFVLNCWSME